MATVSGLAYIAYKHPKAYSQLYVPLSLLGLFAFAVIAVWDGALDHAAEQLRTVLTTDQADVSTNVLSGLKVPLLPTVIVLAIYVAIIIFLLFLPTLLEDNDKKEKPK